MKIKIVGKQINLGNWQTALGVILAICALIGYLAEGTQFIDGLFCKSEAKLQKFNTASSIVSCTINTGTARFSSVMEYYEEANGELLSRLKEITSLPRSITYIGAEAGYGKSWIGILLIKKVIQDSSEIFVFDIKKKFVNESPRVLRARGIDKSMKPELVLTNNDSGAQIELNKLPTFSDSQDFDQFCVLFGRGISKKYIVIDGLDEIHPDKVTQLLNELESSNKYLNKHFLILARGESFLTSRINPPDPSENIRLLKGLSPIKIENTGDLAIRADNWISYYPKNNSVAPLTKPDSLKVQKSLVSLIQKFPFLAQSLTNGANGADLVRYIIESPDSRIEDISEAEIMDELKDGVLKRNSLTHNRPNSRGNNTELYLNILAKIAGHYSSEIDENDGFFRVSSTDVLNVDYQDNSFRFNPVSVLNLSGLISIEPLNSTYSRYRFQPFWLHGYLIKYAKDNCI